MHCRGISQLQIACSDVAENVENGLCMESGVADVLHPECFEAGAFLSDASQEQRIQMQTTMLQIHNACRKESVQV